MLIGRFSNARGEFYGVVEGDAVYPVRDLFRPERTGEPPWPLGALAVKAPVVPSKAVCVGLNYRDHARELGLPVPDEPVLFLKPPTAVIGPGEAVVCPAASSRVDYEAELAVVIGRTARRVRPHDTHHFILGYCCANDVTARDLQRKDGQWTRAKSFDTFLPLGPYVVTDVDPADLEVSLFLNGERKQHSRTRELIFDVPALVSFISHVMTLHPGDVILTGTPSGVGPVRPGDLVEVVIEGVGRLANPVVGETAGVADPETGGFVTAGPAERPGGGGGAGVRSVRP